MSNNDLMLGMSDRTRLSAGITYLMLKGAGYAAIVVFGAWILIALLAWFGRTVLPEDAQLAADPASQAFIDLAERAREADAAAMMPAVAEPAVTDAVATEAAPAEGDADASE